MKNYNIKRVCGNCHYVGLPAMPGAGWIEVLLWLCYLIPGLIYSIWRRGNRRRNICPLCGSPHMLDLNTPRGHQIVAGTGSHYDNITDVAAVKYDIALVKRNSFSWGREAKWFLLFLFVLAFVQGARVSLWGQDLSGGVLSLPFVLAIAVALAVRYFFKKGDLP